MMKPHTTSSTPERRYRAAEGAQDATRQAPTQPCAPNDRLRTEVDAFTGKIPQQR